MLHRAIVGSLERFIGILIEHHAGALPLWLAPQQVVVLNITDRQADYAKSMVGALKAAGLRAGADLRNEKITYKIREHSLQKLPYQLIVGDKENAGDDGGRAYPRWRGSGAMPWIPCLSAFERRSRRVTNMLIPLGILTIQADASPGAWPLFVLKETYNSPRKVTADQR